MLRKILVFKDGVHGPAEKIAQVGQPRLNWKNFPKEPLVRLLVRWFRRQIIVIITIIIIIIIIMIMIIIMILIIFNS